MFNCDNCGKTTENGERQNKVYNYRDKSYENFRVIFDEKTKKKRREYFTTQGKEITEEFDFCNDCYGELDGNESRIRKAS